MHFRMKNYRNYILLVLSTISLLVDAKSYNSHGQTGLINLPSAEVHDEQSIYFTFNRSSFIKLGTLTVTPFDWLEASYFYYRPDDLLWGGVQGLYLDKGFNVKFSYKPDSLYLPRIAIGLDDFAGTGQFTREYFVSTYNFNNIKLTGGLGWGKYVGDGGIKNPFSILGNRFKTRSENDFGLGGKPNFDLLFTGDATPLFGMEISVPKIKNFSFKIENNPFNYFDFACCGEGLSEESFRSRPKDSNINYGLSFKYKDYGNVDFSYIKGNTWNLTFSVGFTSNKNYKKKNKFKPEIKNNDKKQKNKVNEFYLDLLENLNNNRLYLQSANLEDKNLKITVDSSEHINPIIYSSRAAFIANNLAELNDLKINEIEVGHITRGMKINSVSYKTKNLDLYERYPNVLVKRNSQVKDSLETEYRKHEFQPKVMYPIFSYKLAPDIRTHVGSPENFLYTGFGIQLISELQLSRHLVIYSSIGKSLTDNFDEKTSNPNSGLPNVRTNIVDYLQESSEDFYISNLHIDYIWSPYKNFFAKLDYGYLEQMYGGFTGELLYKPFHANTAFSIEYSKVKKRDFNQKLSFSDYKIAMPRLNMAYYHPKTNILAKLSYGKYLASDLGYTLDLSRRMPSGWQAGFFFSRTNVSAEDFGEGSFDKGFYFTIPLSIFSKEYNKNYSGFGLRTMTRDGGQQLELNNRLIDSFYGSTLNEINENWNNFLD